MRGSPLPLGTKIAYGAGELGPAMAGNVLIFYLPIFLTDVAGLSAGLAGSVLLVGKIWDAINDPLVGRLSDRTRHKWGRRLPWMLWLTLPWAAAFVFHWIVPGRAGAGAPVGMPIFWYYVAISILYNLLYTGVTLPYAALTPELAPDYDARTDLNGIRFAFSLVGSILALLCALAIFSWIDVPSPAGGEDRRPEFAALAAAVALVGVASMAWCMAGVWHAARAGDIRATDHTPAPPSLPQELRAAFANRAFVSVCAIFLCSWLAVQVTATVLMYYVTYWMRLADPATGQLVALTVQGTAIAALLPWAKLSRRIGKQSTYVVGMLFWIGAQIGLLFLQPDQHAAMFLLAAAAGLGVSVAYLIPWSMLPDAVDLDELETGRRREGVLYGLMMLTQKIGLALGMFIVGWSLEFAGFISRAPGAPAPAQPESALTAIRWAIGPVPAFFLVLGLVFAWRHPLTRARHAAVRNALEARRAHAASTA